MALAMSDVGHFRAGGARVVDHRVQHLGGHDDRFLGQDALLDEDALDAGDAFLGHFNAQVATGHHDAVGHFEDFVDVVHAFLILNLGNDFDVAAVGVQDFADVEHVLLVAYEGVGDEVDVLLYGIENVVAVFFRQRREVDANSRHVHAFPAGQRGIVAHFAIQGFVVFVLYFQFQFTIVNEDFCAHGKVFHEVGIGNVDATPDRVFRRVADDFHFVSGPIVRALFRVLGRPHFRAFRVH